jgi:hypothetical protein
MARGWESKSVEEQMANALESPVAETRQRNDEEETGARPKLIRAARERQRQALNLQRENILSQRTSNPGRRAALEAALAHIEAQIQSHRVGPKARTCITGIRAKLAPGNSPFRFSRYCSRWMSSVLA